MSQFNLIDEKWIPVRFPDGSRDELGISETLLRAKDIATIEDASPLVVAALHRFLLAVLYRALEGPTDIGQAKKLFKEGLPGEIITAYLEKWRDRFWLCDEKYPFGQVPTFEPSNWRAWSALAVEHNADNAKVLFDHVVIDSAGTISSAAASRWLLATQTFSVSCGKSELAHTGTAPSATAVMVLPIGSSLQDTLIYSLVPQNREVTKVDQPLWERGPESVVHLKEGPVRISFGLADRYTWSIRSIRLMVNDSGRIEKLALASGVGCSSTEQVDPMLAYRIDDKLGKLPFQFRERGIWRDFDSMLPDESQLAPQVVDHVATLIRFDRERALPSIMTLGQANNKAKIEFWRMERFALPGALAGDGSVRSEINQLLTDADNTQKALWIACSDFARNILGRGERPPDKKDIKKFAEQMPVSPMYWSILESNFHELLRGFTLERSSDDIRCQWLKSVRSAVQSAWNQHHTSVATGDAWAIRALVKAEEPVRRKLFELNQEIQKLEPKKEAV
jgi:CRISPR system Cascade subunit CasA